MRSSLQKYPAIVKLDAKTEIGQKGGILCPSTRKPFLQGGQGAVLPSYDSPVPFAQSLVARASQEAQLLSSGC